MEPQLLLLDEPLSNLDAKLRERMRFELKRLQRELGITTVYVTHDQSEALALLALDRGDERRPHPSRSAAPREIYERPRNQFVADFVGSDQLPRRRGCSRATASRTSTACSSQIGGMKVRATELLAQDEIVTISVRPEDIELSETKNRRRERVGGHRLSESVPGRIGRLRGDRRRAPLAVQGAPVPAHQS